MAINIIRHNDEPSSNKLSEFIIDSAADVVDLPTSKRRGAHGEDTCYPGSGAFAPVTGDVWVLGNDDVWHPQ